MVVSGMEGEEGSPSAAFPPVPRGRFLKAKLILSFIFISSPSFPCYRPSPVNEELKAGFVEVLSSLEDIDLELLDRCSSLLLGRLLGNPIVLGSLRDRKVHHQWPFHLEGHFECR
jgi:hypothetical protein